MFARLFNMFKALFGAVEITAVKSEDIIESAGNSISGYFKELELKQAERLQDLDVDALAAHREKMKKLSPAYQRELKEQAKRKK